MNVLGLSAFSGDCSAALISDGKLVAWADEASFTTGPPGLPWRAAAWCLEAGGVAGAHLEVVALAHKPLKALDYALSAALADAPSASGQFADAAAARFEDMTLRWGLESRLGFRGGVFYVERLEALAEASFVQSGFSHAAVVVAGADAEWADAAIGACDLDGIRLYHQLDHPHGLSALWRPFCLRAGLTPRALASLAEGRKNELLREVVDLKDDGSLRLDRAGLEGRRFEALAGGLTQVEIASALQRVTSEALRRMAGEARRLAGSEDLCLAGQAAANDSAMAGLRNQGRLRASCGPLEPALGAAVAAWRRSFKRAQVDLSHAATPPAALSGSLKKPTRLEQSAAVAVKSAAKAAFFGALTPYSLPLRLCGISFLDERFYPQGTYWKRRPNEGEGLRAYRRPF